MGCLPFNPYTNGPRPKRHRALKKSEGPSDRLGFEFSTALGLGSKVSMTFNPV
jgi:hypothetical protein